MGMRFVPYLGIFWALLFLAFVTTLAESSTVAEITLHPLVTGTTTPSLRTATTPPPITLENLFPAFATSTALKPAIPTVATTSIVSSKKPIVSKALSPQNTPVVPPPSFSQTDFDWAASQLRNALINVICTANPGSKLHSISGSGVIIDPKGIILTNAHIAQYFLLADQGVSCVIRTGSPAQSTYVAAPIFISSPWIQKNASLVTQRSPSGTGEYDFSLLAITSKVPSAMTPARIPFLTLAPYAPSAYEPVVIGSYAAQFLETAQIASSLFPTLVYGSIKEIFTFATNTPDVISLGGTVAAQEGSSGGGIADGTGTLIGTITTSTVEGDTASRNLNAITAPYIRAEYLREMGQPLDSLLQEATSTAIASFAPQIPILEALITKNLP